jgi:ribulose-phosphate 3-epimerase
LNIVKKTLPLNQKHVKKDMGTMVAPSLLAADFLNLERDIEMLNRSEADLIHLDIMDGVFVPNISFGFPVINLLQKVTNKPLDVHLMIVQPEKFIDEIAATGATYMNIHYEACTHLHRVVQEIRKKGMKPAVTLNPHTPISLLEDILPDLDMVLLMSVNPGFGGQLFIEHTIRKVDQLKKMINRLHAETLIEVDGGVNFETGKRLVDAGADVLVAGSFVFTSDNPEETIHLLRTL